jgi:myo-inositol-1(or 4)-monophosphatase
MEERAQTAVEIARIGGGLALEYFRRLDKLKIEDKGLQDFVSDADKAVERHVRNLIASAFPEDGIVGEEEDTKPSQTGYTWVIDPIDGTANFISGIPVWCVVIAIVHDDETVVGVTFDPVHDEMFVAQRGHGAQLNKQKLECPEDLTVDRGSVGVGFARRAPSAQTVQVISKVLERGGVFHRNASGALSLAYVAAGRLNGFIEGHMNAWDCLAGQLLVAEAGGHVETQSAEAMICSGGRVIAASAGLFDTLVEIGDACYST